MDTYIHIAEFLCCPLETISTLLIDYIPIQSKKFNKMFKKKVTIFKIEFTILPLKKKKKSYPPM